MALAMASYYVHSLILRNLVDLSYSDHGVSPTNDYSNFMRFHKPSSFIAIKVNSTSLLEIFSKVHVPVCGVNSVNCSLAVVYFSDDVSSSVKVRHSFSSKASSDYVALYFGVMADGDLR